MFSGCYVDQQVFIKARADYLPSNAFQILEGAVCGGVKNAIDDLDRLDLE